MREKGIIDIYIMEILNRYSSPIHRLTQNDMKRYLDIEYGISINRNTLSRYLSDLRQENYIEGDRGVYCKRLFSNSEIKTLINSVMFSKSIPQDEINMIVEKLNNLSEPEARKRMKNAYFVSNIDHTDNLNVCKLVETIDEAIERGKKIEITSCKYDIQGNLTEKGKRIVDPYYIVVEKSRYYLICYSGKQDDVEPRRIDRISNVRILPECRMDINKIHKYQSSPFNIADYMREHIYMYSGESRMVTLKINIDNIGDVIDWYGKGYSVIQTNEKEAVIRIRANMNSVYFWALQYGGIVEVLRPEALRIKIREGVEKLLDKYK